jgi:hypothetical protein
MGFGFPEQAARMLSVTLYGRFHRLIFEGVAATDPVRRVCTLLKF